MSLARDSGLTVFGRIPGGGASKCALSMFYRKKRTLATQDELEKVMKYVEPWRIQNTNGWSCMKCSILEDKSNLVNKIRSSWATDKAEQQ